VSFRSNHQSIQARKWQKLLLFGPLAFYRPGFAIHQFSFEAMPLSGKVLTVHQRNTLPQQSKAIQGSMNVNPKPVRPREQNA
jgi:hypothetical protein